MYQMSFVSNIIKKYVQRKIKKFVIYPFGEDGLMIKNVLQDYFHIEPCYIVDNGYCKYSDEIIGREELRKNYSEDMYIIITAAFPRTNQAIAEELSEYVPAENIINLEQIKNEIKTGFQVDHFLPVVPVKRNPVQRADKVKVRFIHFTAVTWNAISSICEAFQEDPLFEVSIIIGMSREDEKEAVFNQVQKLGCPYVMLDDYNAEDDQPDILIVHNDFDYWTELYHCREFAKVVVAASMEVVRYQDTLQGFWEHQKASFARFEPDFYLYDSLLYNELKESEFYSEQIIHMGNAKFDMIYEFIQKKQYPAGWEKLKGKRTVLWATSHGVDEKEVSEFVTFDLFAQTFFQYALDHQEMGFIFRPHQLLILELLDLGFWSKNDYKRFRQYCDKSANIVYDDTDIYNCAFSIADGILTDANCGIICSALPTLKPICAAYRTKGDMGNNTALLENLYPAYDTEDLIYFLDLIRNQQDPMLEIRQKAAMKYVKNFDGKNGWRIKEFIKQKYFEDN